MCGIVGWLDWNQDLSFPAGDLSSAAGNKSFSSAIVAKMVKALIPRGPDDSGQWSKQHIVFGHRRLAVVDIEGGKQPMTRFRNGWEYCLTYNGELYNTEEIRRELLLKGYEFQGHSDTEVLLLSYIEWGTGCLAKLNGIFAFGIWDSQKDTLMLARDRMGVKPLFFWQRNNSLIFASEIKALLAHPAIPAQVDREGLAELLMIAPARTPGHGVIQNVEELKPGYCLLMDRRTVRKMPYWQLESRPHEDDLATTIEKVRSLVFDAVSRQLVSDVPLGTLLSGGLDSSIITAIAAEQYRQTGRRLSTFSIDYLKNDRFFKANDFQPDPDAPWVKIMSDHFSTKHHYFYLDTGELVDSMEQAVLARDLPGMADIDSSLLLFSQKIKEHVTVGLSGECADEVFGGYPWFHREDLQNAGTFPWATNPETRLGILSPDLLGKIKPLEYLQERYLAALKEVPLPADSPFPAGSPLSAGKDDISENMREETFRNIGYLTLTRFMPTLLDRKDRMTMATGLEVRVPFCDHRLVEYVWNIPWEIKNYQNREKGLLRQAMTGLLPEGVLWRKKSPYPKTHNPLFLQQVSAKLLTILNDSSSPLQELINKKSVLALLENPATNANKPWFGQLMDTPRLFAFLIQLDFWFRNYHVNIIA